MKRFWGHVFVAVVSLAGIGVIDSACAHNDESIFIRGVMAPPSVGVGTQCVYTADPTLPELGSGVLDVALRSSYNATILVGNQLLPQANPDQARTESNRVVLQDAVVTVTTAGDVSSGGSTISGGTQLLSYTDIISGFVDPSLGATPSYGLVTVNILAFDRVMTALPVPTNGGTITLVSHVKIQGQTLGRTNVETNEFDFPIDVCSGCLVSFPAGSENPVLPLPNCQGSLMSSGGNGTIVQPCALGQDQTVDCRLCQGNAACDPAGRATTGGG
jgi:hypothetical protein